MLLLCVSSHSLSLSANKAEDDVEDNGGVAERQKDKQQQQQHTRSKKLAAAGSAFVNVPCHCEETKVSHGTL